MGKKNKRFVGIGIIILILIITNPSEQQFKQYALLEEFNFQYNEDRFIACRTTNYFIFSKYSWFRVGNGMGSGQYIGFLGNFYKTDGQFIPSTPQSQSYESTNNMVDSTGN